MKEVFNVQPTKVEKYYDDFMQRESFKIIADFPDLNLKGKEIYVLLTFGSDTQRKLYDTWCSNIGSTIAVVLEHDGNDSFTLKPII